MSIYVIIISTPEDSTMQLSTKKTGVPHTMTSAAPGGAAPDCAAPGGAPLARNIYCVQALSLSGNNYSTQEDEI